MIDVAALLSDDDNEAKMLAHRLSVDEVQQVRDKWPRYYANRADRRASHVIIGPTCRRRILVVPIEQCGKRIWRPVTAFEVTPSQAARYRSGR